MGTAARRPGVAAVWSGLASAALLGLIFAAPWAYGGVEQWFRAIAAAVLAGVCVVTAGLAVAAPGRGFPAALAPAAPLAVLAAVGGLQLAGGVSPADPGQTPGIPGTIYPALTRLGLATVAVVAAATVLGGLLFRNDRPFHVLLFACLASAATVAVVGIGMRLTGEDRMIRGLPVVGDPFARFVNRNNGAAYLQIGVCAGFALLRATLSSPSDDDPATFLRAGRRPADRATVAVAVAVLMGACLAGAVASRSRGGMAAAAATVIIGTGLLCLRGGVFRLATAAAFAGVAAALILWLGLSGAALERFRSVTADSVASEGRVPNWRDAGRAIAARPLWGTGVGTYGFAYQLRASNPSEKWFSYADNEFVELLVEAGAAGAVAAAVGAAILAVGLARGGRRPVERVLLSTLVAGQSVHAVFDYAIIVPAVGLAAASLWGASLARIFAAGAVPEPPGRSGRAAVCVVTLAVGGALVPAAVEHGRAWAVDSTSAPANRLEGPRRIEADETDRAIDRLRGALARRSDDAEGQRALAALLVHRYRLTVVDRLVALDATLSPERAWRATSLPSLHGAANRLRHSGAVGGAEALRADPAVAEFLVPATDALRAAVAGCPRLPGVRLPAACLAFVADARDPSGARDIESAARLFPAEPETQRLAGRLAWQAGEADLAGRCWRRAFSLTPEGYGEVAGRLAAEVGPAEAVALTLPEDAVAALRVCSPGRIADAGLRGAIGPRLAAAADSLDGPAGARVEAIAAWFAGRDDEAERRFQEAVARYPSNAATRADFATFLRDVGRYAEASEALAVASALDPRAGEYRRLLMSWNRNTPSSAVAPSGGELSVPKK